MSAPLSPLVHRHADVLLVGLPRDVVQAAGLFGIPNGDLTQSEVGLLSDHCERLGVGAWLPGHAYQSSIETWDCPPINLGLAKIKNASLDVGVLLMGRTPRPHSHRQGDCAFLQGVWHGRPDCAFVFPYALNALLSYDLNTISQSAHDTWNTVWNDSYPMIRGIVLDTMWDVHVLESHKQAWCQMGDRLLRHHALEAALPTANETISSRF